MVNKLDSYIEQETLLKLVKKHNMCIFYTILFRN